LILSTEGGLQISITNNRTSESTTIAPVTIKTEPNTISTVVPIAFSKIHPDIIKCFEDSENSNFLFWIVIGFQLFANVALAAYISCRRFFGYSSTLLQIARVVDNVPPPYQEFTSPIEEVVDLPPTARAAFQHPPPTAEAVYEVSTNYGEEPTVRREKLAVYEGHQFDKNNPLTPQHNVYAKTLDQQEDGDDCYYSTIKT
jgi:hypothetical protein